jgi:hypothetical protein
VEVILTPNLAGEEIWAGSARNLTICNFRLRTQVWGSDLHFDFFYSLLVPAPLAMLKKKTDQIGQEVMERIIF